jgi:hypothetical protein
MANRQRMSDDINGGFDIAEIEKWLGRYFRTGMSSEVGGFPACIGKAPDRNYLFWQMVNHFGNDVRPILMRSHIWTFH